MAEFIIAVDGNKVDAKTKNYHDLKLKILFFQCR